MVIFITLIYIKRRLFMKNRYLLFLSSLFTLTSLVGCNASTDEVTNASKELDFTTVMNVTDSTLPTKQKSMEVTTLSNMTFYDQLNSSTGLYSFAYDEEKTSRGIYSFLYNKVVIEPSKNTTYNLINVSYKYKINSLNSSKEESDTVDFVYAYTYRITDSLYDLSIYTIDGLKVASLEGLSSSSTPSISQIAVYEAKNLTSSVGTEYRFYGQASVYEKSATFNLKIIDRNNLKDFELINLESSSTDYAGLPFSLLNGELIAMDKEGYGVSSMYLAKEEINSLVYYRGYDEKFNLVWENVFSNNYLENSTLLNSKQFCEIAVSNGKMLVSEVSKVSSYSNYDIIDANNAYLLKYSCIDLATGKISEVKSNYYFYPYITLQDATSNKRLGSVSLAVKIENKILSSKMHVVALDAEGKINYNLDDTFFTTKRNALSNSFSNSKSFTLEKLDDNLYCFDNSTIINRYGKEIVSNVLNTKIDVVNKKIVANMGNTICIVDYDGKIVLFDNNKTFLEILAPDRYLVQLFEGGYGVIDSGGNLVCKKVENLVFNAGYSYYSYSFWGKDSDGNLIITDFSSSVTQSTISSSDYIIYSNVLLVLAENSDGGKNVFVLNYNGDILLTIDVEASATSVGEVINSSFSIPSTLYGQAINHTYLELSSVNNSTSKFVVTYY